MIRWRRCLMIAMMFVLSVTITVLVEDAKVSAEKTRSIDLVDSHASNSVRSLFVYLQEISGEKVLFGHQHATDEGITIKGEGSRVGSTESEVKNSVGDYPAVFGWDTLSLDGYEKPGILGGTDEKNRANLIQSMQTVHELGGIITLSMHPHNFLTGGDFNDTSSKQAVAEILPGGSANEAFKKWLDNLALFAHELKDDNGEKIPVIFRPFHEQNGGWFWWGAQTTTTSEYKELYRYTVEYLRDIKEVNNFLYAFSPNGPFDGNIDAYLTTYPGDDYVDILGLDQYDNQNSPGTEVFLKKLGDDLAMISQLAEKKDKIAALTEFGYSPQGMKVNGNGDVKWFTKLLDAIKENPDAKKIAYMQTWANFALDGNLFVPYKDSSDGFGEHELLPDFTDFYNDPYTAFRNDVEGVYTNSPIDAEEKAGFMHIVTPTANSELKTASTIIRARILHDLPEKVVYSVNGSEEIEMSLDEAGFYYTAEWSPPASVNGESAEITVKAYGTDGRVIHEQMVSIVVKVSEIELLNLTFDETIDRVKSNGAYPESIHTELAHEVIDGNGMLKILAYGLEQNQTWQELKLELTQLEGVDLNTTKQVVFDTFIPVVVGKEATVRGIVMLPPDWETKYGMTTTEKTISDLEIVTLNGADYAKYPVTIDLDHRPADLETPTGMAISLVGNGFKQDSEIYVDNIRLLSSLTEEPLDPTLIDDFESYLGSNDNLHSNFIPANGSVKISLSEINKYEGNYGMQYDYTLSGAGSYTGITKKLDGLDWSEYKNIKFWLHSDGKDQKMVIQLVANGVYYEAYPSLATSGEHTVYIHFDEFTPAPWESEENKNKELSSEERKNVTAFSIYMNANEELEDELKSTLYFDDIRVVDEEPESEKTPEEGEGTATPEEGEGTATPEEGEGTATPEEGEGTATPEEGEGIATPEEGEGTAAPEAGTETPEEENSLSGSDEGNQENKLPNTATSDFNRILLGVILLLMGAIAIYYTRKKKI